MKINPLTSRIVVGFNLGENQGEVSGEWAVPTGCYRCFSRRGLRMKQGFSNGAIRGEGAISQSLGRISRGWILVGLMEKSGEDGMMKY